MVLSRDSAEKLYYIYAFCQDTVIIFLLSYLRTGDFRGTV